ncbi:M17 family peptidase N-terminal domain-containing protein [Leptolyngbya boryana]|uniref:M17 family peptidase N-terminal domain-containing protein n=1 Tax=Leptolyngbya boryana TaxID=1184 RepID=UPI000364BE4D|nr:M17 family peptidase N-terminal domain-containing protein [Leptolyngbya boryana]
MNVTVTGTSLLDWSGDGLAIALFEGAELSGDVAALDQKLSGAIAELIAEVEFKGKLGNTASTRIAGSSIRKILLVGLGNPDDLKLEKLRQAAASVAKLAKRERCKTLALSFPTVEDAAATTQAIVG